MNRGPNKFPHWHATDDHAAKALEYGLTKKWFDSLTPREFAVWCNTALYIHVSTFFYANGWPEGLRYCRNNFNYAALTAYPALSKHQSNWHNLLSGE